MSAISVTCPSCGDVDLRAEEVSLNLHPSGPRGSFRFVCPGCGSAFDRPASREVVAVLIAAGVRATPREDAWRELDPSPAHEDRSPDPAAPAFTLDDVIAFHDLLQDDDALTRRLSLDP